MNPFPSGFKLFLIPPAPRLRIGWRLVSPSGRAVRLTYQQGIIMGQLMGRYERPVFRGDLLEAIWGDAPDGGPLCTTNVIKVQLNRMRHVCRAMGIDFDCGSNWAHTDKDNAYTLKNLRECKPIGKIPLWYSDREHQIDLKEKMACLLTKKAEDIFFSYHGVPASKVLEWCE